MAVTAAVETTLADYNATAAGAPPGVRIPVEVHLTVDDPYLAYRRARDEQGVFLETTGGQAGWGYFGVNPSAMVTVDPGQSALGRLTELVSEEVLRRGDCDIPYPCGLLGWLSYDVARELEDLPESAKRDRELPRMQFGRFETLAAWQEPRASPTRLRITACPRLPDPTDEVSIRETYEKATEMALALASRIQEGGSAVGPPRVAAETVTFESDCSQAAFANRVQTVQSHIREGDTFQANISQRLRAPAAVHPVEAYAALRQVNPAPYSALVEFPGVDLVSASPELLLERTGERVVTEPIAGTRPRGETEADDASFEQTLRDDEKERAEHAMLVDLERNDLGKVCTYGSVDVTEYRRVDRYAEVMHLVSLVEGELRDGCALGELVGAVFPGGTITGAPKPKTMSIIDEVEPTRRGPYTGSIGIIGYDQRATLNIIIRTLVRYEDEYHLRVGAGIVHDSVPEREYEETLDKGRALVTAVDQALGERIEMGVSKSP